VRAEARLTQEEQAKAASLSLRSVSDLGPGIHITAHKDRRYCWAGALGLAGVAREQFVAAAHGRDDAAGVLAARQGAARAFAAAATQACRGISHGLLISG
jgi:hypothetical protein